MQDANKFAPHERNGRKLHRHKRKGCACHDQSCRSHVVSRPIELTKRDHVPSCVCTARTHELNELVANFTDTKEKGSARVEVACHVLMCTSFNFGNPSIVRKSLYNNFLNKEQ